ncbi:MAG: DNA gyrase subunit A [Lachnospiraceae bacterium]|nr:DNA gyrase subunit A [Lachnospiraceae bacterium]
MDDTIFDRIQDVDLNRTMRNSYIDYAMSVIASRALPDVRDGLKPVQRRILFAMSELGNSPDKPHRKCARIVGDTMGKYHPHGDSSIYGALVYMAQPWSVRYTLVDGHGNFGSVDGDGAAAMRYTEARLTKISMEMMADLNKDTVDFVPNFDETEKEPAVLPARFPNLLVNGTTGIAVGMATNIPPHNLREVVAACTKMINNRIEEDRDTQIEEILDIVKAPDFPTGGVIMGLAGAREAYMTGKGKVITRAVTNIESMANGKSRIVVTELPYLVNKANLIKNIADLVKNKRIEGITDLRDESDREGMRIVIELRHDANANVVLNQLFKHTQMQDTFGVIMLSLVNNEPKVLNILEMLKYYLLHQEDVVTRRTKYDLNKAEERDHILQGLLVALDNIDEVVSIIRHSKNVQEAKASLIERFGLDDAQAQAIVDMRLRALTGLERDKLEAEHAELLKTIERLKAILGDEKLLLAVIRDEMNVIAEKYGDDRRTKIDYNAEMSDFEIEDLIKNENVVITRTNLGYIKRMTVDNFHAQNRGGRGIKGLHTIEEDYIEDLLMTATHNMILFFTNKGRVYKLKTYKIPEASRTSRGTAIVNLLQLEPDEKISALIPFDDYDKSKDLFFVTRKGIVKKTSNADFANISRKGIRAINLNDDDELIEVKQTSRGDEIYIVTKYGMAIRFKEDQVRHTGRSSMGVKGIELQDDDEVVGMQLGHQGDSLLIVSEKGMGKRSVLDDFRLQKRGGKGLKCYRITEKTGNVVGVKAVTDDHEIMMITSAGIIIQIRMNEVSVRGRITSGVKLINLEEGVKVVAIAKVRDDIEDEKDADGTDAEDSYSENNLNEEIN